MLAKRLMFRGATAVVLCALLVATADAARARPLSPPTDVPLELVFADSFESGDVCAWTLAIPPGGTIWYLDADGDGYGDPGATTVACSAPGGYVANADDCDDASAFTYPGAAPLDSATACMLDADDDDYGSSAPPAGVTAGTDCDDASSFTFPGAAPLDSPSACMRDLDADDYGSSTPPAGVTAGTDCDDEVAAVHPGAPDDPDPLYRDDNCDGIDGDVARAAFAAPTGDDLGSCTLGAPCLTIGHAAAVASADPLRDHVYVQAGLYPEILDLPTGVAIFGGYDAAWFRDDYHLPDHAATIQGGYAALFDAYLTVRASAVTASLADLEIACPNATPGGPSVLAYSTQAVLATQSSLTLSNVTILPNDAEPGADGANGPSASQVPAMVGGTGADGDENPVICSTARPPGGSQGTNTCGGVSTDGGSGGAGGSKDSDCSGIGGTCSGSGCNARPGLAGSAGVNGGGTAGPGGAPCGAPPGLGGPGAVANGAGGTGGATGGFLLLPGGQWHAHAGSAGAPGAHGKGGGGGGGAGGCDTGIDDSGPGGGGGGAGGCRAPAGGGGGGGGGGLFGIVAIDNSTLVVTDSEFLLGAAGAGGQGGAGGFGQPGGPGGPGGQPTPDTIAGGRGGDGGYGGHSGGGGGGTGGRTCGILSLASSVTESGNTYVGASGGPGGPGGGSAGNSGFVGANGTGANVCTCATATDC